MLPARKESFCEDPSKLRVTLFYHAVPVSVQGGGKMSLYEVLSFFDQDITWKNQEAQKFLEEVSRKELDPIFAAESLFKETVLDSGTIPYSGGWRARALPAQRMARLEFMRRWSQ